VTLAIFDYLIDDGGYITVFSKRAKVSILYQLFIPKFPNLNNKITSVKDDKKYDLCISNRKQ
jgi:hypothetical protein